MGQKHGFGVISLYMTYEAKTKWHYRWKVQETGSKTRSRDVQTVTGQGDAAAAAAKSLQSCPALCDPIDGSPPGSSLPGILQARTLEWVAISFSSA